MAIQVRWQNAENTAITWTFNENWTLQDMHMAYVRTCEMIAAQDHRVDLIGIIEHSMPFESLDFVRHYTIGELPPNFGTFILVGTNHHLYVIFTLMRMMETHRLPTVWVGSLAEANALLSSRSLVTPRYYRQIAETA